MTEPVFLPSASGSQQGVWQPFGHMWWPTGGIWQPISTASGGLLALSLVIVSHNQGSTGSIWQPAESLAALWLHLVAGGSPLVAHWLGLLTRWLHLATGEGFGKQLATTGGQLAATDGPEAPHLAAHWHRVSVVTGMPPLSLKHLDDG